MTKVVRPRRRDALALPTGQLHPALTADRVVLLLEFFDELFTVCNSAYCPNLIHGGARIRKGNVLGNSAVEQKIVLHDDAEMRTEVAQAQSAQVFPVDFNCPGERMIEVHCQTDEC